MKLADADVSAMEALSSRLSEGSALEAGNLRPVFCLVLSIRLHVLFHIF